MADKCCRIGVISDTHGLLRNEVKDILRTCQVILHGGDIDKPEILDELKKIGDLYVVRGNNDKEWAGEIPQQLRVDLFGLRIFMVHKKKHLPENLGDVDLIVYGHSHKYEELREGCRLRLNPGSCGPRRFQQPITMAVVETEAGSGTCTVERIEIPYVPANG